MGYGVLWGAKTASAVYDGFVFVYLSNESGQVSEVFFDDMRVELAHGPLLQETGYYPFGLETYQSNASGMTAQRYLNQGKELQTDFDLGTYDFHARMYDPQLGKTWQMDPMADSYYPWSPYTWVMGNPLKYMDPTGMFSTHTNEDGNVVAVYDDGDLGVYRHEGSITKEDIDSKHSDSNTSAGGEKMGETEYWDEFRAHDNKTGDVLESVMEGAKIMFGETWDLSIRELNNQAEDMNLLEIRDESRSDGDFDIKANSELAPYGAGTGKMLNGKYASARSAGNYLAGYNAAGGRFANFRLTRTGYMKLAGAYHSQGKLTRGMITNIFMNSASYGPPPYYGEIPYAGRMIVKGWMDKKWER